MKKVINILLITVLIFPIITFYSPGIAVASAQQEHTSSSLINDGYFSEAFESNGVKYFYEDTSEYTIVITNSISGEQTVSYKDKIENNNDEILYSSTTANTNPTDNEFNYIDSDKIEITPLEATQIKNLEEIKNDFLSGEISTEKIDLQTISKQISSNNTNDRNQIASVSKVTQALQNEYGSSYLYRYLTSMTRNGHTGTLYQHLTYSTVAESSRLFDVLTGIGVIATFFGTPVSGLLGIASWVSAGAGAYQLSRATSFSHWNTTVHLQKVVGVANIYPYRAYYDRHLRAVTGSRGTAALGPIYRTFKNSDYDNNTSLLIRGIDLYRNY